MELPGEGGEMAAALRAAKRALRGELRQRLRALGEAEKQRQSRLLTRKVISHPKYQESKRIAIFLSMPDEIQTEEIIKDIFKQGKECFIPRYKPHSNHMDMLKLSSAEDILSLALTSWNILQPSDDDSAREEALAGEKEQECTADPGEENSTLQINEILGLIREHPQCRLSKHNMEACDGDRHLLGVA
ncbi:5-formyltetrahydrofolate cyclo-ligase isoform X3 [Colius striatus]|uniref:5-formyltetrahydrofolate cyclo-ligase isoform X3 n=1 Tax=Colius striatus TaxID=57412 RepID=UPI002B1D6B88|nr:5-formyltetrahydrofolate cyclo-ligase isoform X3 [Colius striatus]